MRRAISACIIFLFLAVAVSQANERRYAPLRAQILSAKTVFLAGGPPAVLDKAYGELQKWGRFQLASEPAQADVVLEFRYGMARAPESARVSVYDPTTGNTSYGSATTPGVWSELLTITDAKTKEVLYEDGRAGSPPSGAVPVVVSAFKHPSMARDMLKDLRKRIDATESAQIFQYAAEFGERAAKYFTDAATRNEKAVALGENQYTDSIKDDAIAWRRFASQLTQWDTETAKSLPNATPDSLAKKSEEIKKYRDQILAYTCSTVERNRGLEREADTLRIRLPSDFVQAIDAERDDAAALSADCNSAQAIADAAQSKP